MNILEKIIAHKRTEVKERSALYPVKLLEQSLFFNSPSISLKKYIQRKDLSGIIAEIKRQSPSKGAINPYVSVERTSIGYMQAGASALSILTDNTFFGGKNEDLSLARKFNYCPILRKDFVIDAYQLVEAKSIGADAILLIAAALSPEELKSLAKEAKVLGLEVLMEVHNQEELGHLNEYVDILGVNNRNLTTFEVDVQTSIDLVKHIPEEFVKISESGISKASTIIRLKNVGYEGFLVGETFMKNSRPERACARFVEELNKLEVQERLNNLLA